MTIPTEYKLKFEMSRAHKETPLCGRESASPEKWENQLLKRLYVRCTYFSKLYREE